MSVSGIPAHISFKHRGLVLAEFRRNPVIMIDAFLRLGYFPREQKSLPSPSALTVYSRRPLGFMAAPIKELRRPKGYQPPQNYGRPADILAGQARYGRNF